MEVYETEEQQVDAIKSWIKENGKAVVLGAVIGLGGLWGWKFYQSEQILAKEVASESYNQVVIKLQKNSSDALVDAKAFIDDNEESQYSVLVALQLAKIQIEANQLDDALTQLNWVISNTKDEAILPLAVTRKARTLSEQQKFTEALSALGSVKAEGWKARIAELRGDIQLQSGDVEAARFSYTEAQQLGGSPLLQMKLDDLAK
ncbi:MAG: YfgM family protein [Aliivibrio sp.]|uniref:YfgM family protein n=1 Tax=Aliivibrio sp. TaxID=1872443 RepID=UPI001A4D292C|nr:YfgM family protein [Aliivibrio sp.]